uniref:Uncharacterized protein n=1 Tax=Panagrolaimus sp. ES5 TaxID=591445 RepID=A0AC34FSY5_9BILA
MEALNNDLDKTVHDFIEIITEVQSKNGIRRKPLSAIGYQRLGALISSIDNVLKFYEAKIIALTYDNAELTKSMNKFKSLYEFILSGVSQMNDESEENEKLKTANGQLKHENDEMKATVEDFSQKISELNQSCDMKEAEKNAMEQKIKDLENRISTFKTNVTQLSTKTVAEEEDVPQKLEMCHILDMEIEDLKVELKERNKTVANLEEAVRQHENEKIQREKNIAVFEKMIDDQSKYIQRLETSNGGNTSAVFQSTRGQFTNNNLAIRGLSNDNRGGRGQYATCSRGQSTSSSRGQSTTSRRGQYATCSRGLLTSNSRGQFTTSNPRGHATYSFSDSCSSTSSRGKW